MMPQSAVTVAPEYRPVAAGRPKVLVKREK